MCINTVLSNRFTNLTKCGFFLDMLLKKCILNILIKNISINLFFLEKHSVDFFFRNFFFNVSNFNISNYKIFNIINILMFIFNTLLIVLFFNV